MLHRHLFFSTSRLFVVLKCSNPPCQHNPAASNNPSAGEIVRDRTKMGKAGGKGNQKLMHDPPNTIIIITTTNNNNKQAAKARALFTSPALS